VECVADRALAWAAGEPGPLEDGADVEGLVEVLANRLEKGQAFLEDPIRLASAIASISATDWSSRLLDAFVRLLGANGGADQGLELLDAIGLLEKLVPGWSDVRGRPQRDPYHLYPVDVHLMQAVAEARRLLREPEEPFAQAAAGAGTDPTALLLAAFLHDVGKVGRGSHGPLGVEIAGTVLDRMGIAAEMREDVLFLVGEHLLLSDTATRRNLEDEDLILHVSAVVGDERRLALLYLLTVADALATGPTASTPWRLGLVRDLVAKVSHAFERGLMDRDRAGRLERAEAILRQTLDTAGVSPEEARAFLQTIPPGYALWVMPEDAPGHLALIIPRPGEAEVRTAVRPGRTPGTYQLSLGAIDRLGLLATVAGSMTLSGLSILSAQAFTTEEELALDVFEVRGAFEDEVGEDRWERFTTLLRKAIEGKVDLGQRIHLLRSHYRRAPGGAPVSVRVEQEASDFFTIIEVSAPDRLGLLFDLASTLSRHELDVHVAKVATYGPRVVDVFYVRDSAGEKPTDPARFAELERDLIAASREP